MFAIFLNKTQTLSSHYIVCVVLMLCSGLLGYKFALICDVVVLMLNLIIIIIIIIILKKLSNPIYMGWVGLDFFLTHYGVLG